MSDPPNPSPDRSPDPSDPVGGPHAAEPRDSDPDLVALPAPPRFERSITVGIMVVAAMAALFMAWSLLGEARYAVAAEEPIDLGVLSYAPSAPWSENTYVEGAGVLDEPGGIRYARAGEGDAFRLSPIVGNPQLWVETRIPKGLDGPRFVPPATFAGRLVRLRHAGVRYAGLGKVVLARTGHPMPADAWILIDGSSPQGSRWALALVMLLAGFAAWNLFGVARILARVRDSALG